MTRVAVVGAGIIGAAIAYRLARAGAEVTLIDRATPGAGARDDSATENSFAWINAHDPENAVYNAFRREAIAAWRRLGEEAALPIRWGGALSWEGSVDERRDRSAALAALGLDAGMVDEDEIRRRAPDIAPPPGPAFFCADDGAVDASDAAAALSEAAAAAGARLMAGVEARALLVDAGRVAGVETDGGVVTAEVTVLAAGLGALPLAASAGVRLPVGAASGFLIRTRPVTARLDQVVLTPGLHVRQTVGGALLAGEAFSGAVDDAERAAADPDAAAGSILAKLRALFPGTEIELDTVLPGRRPAPEDGLPVIGTLREGLYGAVMHSGVTLAALVGELAAVEATGGAAEGLDPFRITRFGG